MSLFSPVGEIQKEKCILNSKFACFWPALELSPHFNEAFVWICAIKTP